MVMYCSEGVPGLAKTLLLKNLAAATAGTLKRIQFFLC